MGDVNLNIGEVMHFNNDSYDDCLAKITETIKQSYKNHATNYAAAILQGKNFANNEFTNEEIDDAITYLNKKEWSKSVAMLSHTFFNNIQIQLF